MKRWTKRIGYAIFLLFWLVIMAFPTFAFFLATKGELQFGDNEQSYVRVFLVQEETSSGVGVEWVRAARQVDDCSRTTIHYFLWEGSHVGQNVSFCQCYDPLTHAPLPIEESSCSQ